MRDISHSSAARIERHPLGAAFSRSDSVEATSPSAMASASASPTPLFSLRDASVQLGQVRALRHLTLDIAPGERVALVGANGSGKSSLLRLLNGLVSASDGQVLRHSSARQAMLFQRPHMLRASAQNNLALGLWLAGTAWGQAKSQALSALDRVGLADLARRNAKTLSGGQQQRLALARAWALRPDVMLLDEPTASLDPHAKREVEALMAEFAQGQGGDTSITLVFASHNLGQVKRLASRVLYLEQGRLLVDLPVADFFNRALLAAQCPQAHLFVQGELV